MAEQNLTEAPTLPDPDVSPDPPALPGYVGGDRIVPMTPTPSQVMDSYADRARTLADNVRNMKLTDVRPPPQAIPDERIDHALEALADCISSAVVSAHPRKFQAIRRIAKIAELLAREKSARGVADVTERPALGGFGAGAYLGGGVGDNDLDMGEDQPQRIGGPMFGVGMNDGAQLTRDMTAALQQQADTQRGQSRARELRDLQDMRGDMEHSLKSKRRQASHGERERLQSELDVIQKRIDTLLDEIKRELKPEEPTHAVVHP